MILAAIPGEAPVAATVPGARRALPGHACTSCSESKHKLDENAFLLLVGDQGLLKYWTMHVLEENDRNQQ